MSTTVKNFYGRKKELSILESKIKLQRSNLVIIRGRRRIGKTTLVKYFAQKYSFWQFEGLAPTIKTSKQNQIDNFMLQLSLQSNASKMILEDWIEVFKVFSGYISNKKTVILFDEISWMGSKDPDFLSKIKFAWDNFFANKKNVLLIICGSASSWIEKNLISSTGFVGRISQIITLEGLDISYVRTFWRNKDISSYEILKILCITGTIPKYLEEIDPKLTAEENISNLCFQKGGFLVEEFNRIFSFFIYNTKNKRRFFSLFSTYEF